MMTRIADLKPVKKPTVMFLLEKAGLDTSDWGKFKGGRKRAASNPKYCYNWSYMQPNKLVVLNLWYSAMRLKNGKIVQNINMRKFSNNLEMKPVWRKRAANMDNHIQSAYISKLTVRVIVNDGVERKKGDQTGDAAQVKKRMLDPEPWSIIEYNLKSGKCILSRGVDPERFVDQFMMPGMPEEVERYEVNGKVYKRRGEVRKNVLARAKGRCEFCNEPGFVMENRNIFLETHHVLPLSEKGKDDEGNVIALCPNHHREAHFGTNKKELQEKFNSYLEMKD